MLLSTNVSNEYNELAYLIIIFTYKPCKEIHAVHLVNVFSLHFSETESEQKSQNEAKSLEVRPHCSCIKDRVREGDGDVE